ncbi:DUF2480 family protein [Salinimicrobium xinjiangense]|uniref:DUF2480 family protein n=1 Tax=Salinimicrobium xinjiangense TaxID=438596 RepID=UPI0003FF871E|nr:DUF2480 family protein [Salinimicrobium xinjiangense]
MAEEIINRVANSKLVTINLEDYYPQGERVMFDIKDWLLEEFVLREKDFRASAKSHDWSQYAGKFVALTCSSDAIIPGWAHMLLSTYLAPVAKKVVVGDLEMLETILYTEILSNLDLSEYTGIPVIIKGCSRRPVPQNAYLQLINKLQPIAKSIMYGEACSSVPLFKK